MVRAGVSASSPTARRLHPRPARVLSDEGEGLWRRLPHIDRNGNLYPTHGLGRSPGTWHQPGDRFTRLVSMSCRAGCSPTATRRRRRRPAPQSLHLRRHEHAPPADHPGPHRHAAARRRPPTPLQPHQPDLGLEGRLRRLPAPASSSTTSPATTAAEPMERFKAVRTEHPLWQRLERARRAGGHGGMDFIMNYRLLQPTPGAAGHRRLRRRGLVSPRRALRAIGGLGQHAPPVPGLHPRAVEGHSDNPVAGLYTPGGRCRCQSVISW